MPDPDKTEIVVVLDRSGSMQTIAEDMVGGFLTFVREQEKQPGEATLSLYQFDTHYDVVYESKPLRDITELTLVPRGGTALLDALGKTIVTVGERLAALEETKRPGTVIVLVITDGRENKSKEYKLAQVQALIKQQTEQYQWAFAYLGADASTFADARDLGVQANSVLGYQRNSAGVRGAYDTISRSVARHRAARAAGKLDVEFVFPTNDQNDSGET